MKFIGTRDARRSAFPTEQVVPGTIESELVPVLAKGRPMFVGFRCGYLLDLSREPSEGQGVGPPIDMVMVDAVTGERGDAAEAEARLARVKVLPAAGFRRYPPDQHAKGEELADALDAVMPAFAAGVANPDVKVRAAAQVVDRRLEEVGPGMRPYYVGASPEFFVWLGKVVAAK